MSKKLLEISAEVSLPADAVTQTFGDLGRKGGGKTYGATKRAEELAKVGAQFVAIDPVGNWYGLRLAADGKSQGLSIYVFGGLHGDTPINPEAGALIADVVIDTGISAVVDVSQFRKAQRKRFVADFAEQLFQRKKAEPSPIHLFFEECQKFAPQRAGKDEERMLGAIEDIVRLGRNYGIGSSMLSQRPQSVNKEVLNQAECLSVYQINGTQERKAIQDWVRQQGLDIQEMVDSLPSLHQGECYLWSPQWLRILQKIHVKEKWTYDASATPKLGEKPRVIKTLSPVDLKKIEGRMADLVKESEARDPAKLRKRIRELEIQLAKKPGGSAPRVETVEIQGIPSSVVTQIRELQASTEKHSQVLENKFRNLEGLIKNLPIIDGRKARHTALPKEETTKPPPRRPAPDVPPAPAGGTEKGDLGKGPKAMLDALSRYHPTALNPVQLGILSGYAHKGGSYQRHLSTLRSRGLVETNGAREIRLTEEGHSVAGYYDGVPKPDVLELWLKKLGKGPATMLRKLDEYGPLTRDELGEKAGYEPSGGSFQRHLSTLRSNELVLTIDAQVEVVGSNVYGPQ